MSDERTAFRTCPLCEAGCGLEIAVKGDRVGRIRGDQADVFSHGYLCPKGSTLRQLHEDPDRLRQPLVRRDGGLVAVSWPEAFAEIERRFAEFTQRHGREALGVYVGNPNAHNLSALLYLKPLLKSLGTRNVFSASTVDQRPKELSSAWLFGGGLTIPVPDIDRTDLLVILGANPYASNGSLATAPDWPGRIEAMRARGGTLVVVDPRRSRTAEEADLHLAVRPGTDALLLAAIVTSLAANGQIDTGAAGEWIDGVDAVVAALSPFTPEAVAPAVGVDAAEIESLASMLASAPSAAVYGRIGTTTAEFGTLASWLVDVVNASPATSTAPAAMFAKAAAGASNTRGAARFGRELRVGRHRSRVRGIPEAMGELPAACMAEEIDTPGDGQIRAMVTVAGNPVLSTPNSERLDAAMADLELYVAVDIYLNETTRHADVILPPPKRAAEGPLRPRPAAARAAQRRQLLASGAPLDADQDGAPQPDEWEILAKLALIAQGMGADAAPSIVDDLVVATLVQAAVGDEHGPLHGRDVDEVLGALAPHGPRAAARPAAAHGALRRRVRRSRCGRGPGVPPLTLDVLLAHPHGVDLGPLEPRLPDVLRTPTGRIDLGAGVPRRPPSLGRRARSPGARRGARRAPRPALQQLVDAQHRGPGEGATALHPPRAPRRRRAVGVVDGARAVVTGRVGRIEVPVEVTDAVRTGVVSLPHGWGHDLDGASLSVAQRYAGVNSNVLSDDAALDALSGNAVLNGIPVAVAPA
ncbi:MAG: molybdopterin-dependent oxidoreductase [Acidimicrobiales bacterium]